MSGLGHQCWPINAGLAVATSFKAGFSSFRNTCGKPILKAEARSRGMIIRLYIRHPIERARSAWSMYAASNKHIDCVGAWPTWPAFVDAILDGWDDLHWQPQIEQHDIYDECYRFETIAETWPGPPLRHDHQATIEKPALGYRMPDLNRYYAADLAAWSGARH